MGAVESSLDELANSCYSDAALPQKQRKQLRSSDCCHPQLHEDNESHAAVVLVSDKEVEEVCQRQRQELRGSPPWAAARPQEAGFQAAWDDRVGDESQGLELRFEAVAEPCMRIGAAPEAWRAQLLTQGAQVLLEGEPVTLAVDLELGCLEVREHEALYPLAELRTCDELPHAADAAPGGLFGLVVDFADLDTLVLQFDCAEERAGFKAALDLFAADARRERLPEPHQALPGQQLPIPVLVQAA